MLHRMPKLHVLRVFASQDGSGGNPLGVFLDGAQVPAGERQAIAAELGFSETVFVDDPESGEMRIFTPTVELQFAGHPTVGTAWLLAHERGSVEVLRPPAGEVGARSKGTNASVTADPDWAPWFEWEQLPTPTDVDALDGPHDGHDAIGYWSWVDERAGLVRARVFPVRYGVAEDEATGAAAILLCARIGREIEIRQGRGSVLHARPGPGQTVELGGRVELDEVRQR
jgi:predicted PhzF superfamily epimerase YddE/YHI9